MTRVALVVESTAYGGAEAYAGQLLRHLPGSVDRVLVATETAPRRLVDGARRLAPVVPVAAERDGRADAAALKAALHRLAADVVHVSCVNAQHDRAALDVAAIVAPVVATLHLPLPLAGVPRLPALRATYARLSRCIAVSAPGVALLTAELRVPPRRVVRIRNGVDLRPQVRAREDAGGRPRLLSVARLDRQKGLDVLLEALLSVPAHHRPASLTVLGEGPEREHLQRQAAPLVRSGTPVALPGERADVAAELARADVFCLPSREEGLPLALLEAMAAGLPCVATDVGDVAAAAGDAALVVPAEDATALAGALTELARDPARRRRLGATARERAERCFDVRRTADRTAEVYEQAIREEAHR